MPERQVTEFPPEVIEKLRHYVYRLIDPRNGETFYIGKGKGNRVFSHARGALRTEDFGESNDIDPKLKRILEINNGPGQNVIHIIHRHDMDADTALEVEAALIDATPGLTNQAGGHHSNDRGPRNPAQIMELFHAEEARLEHKALILNVGQSLQENERPLDAARYAWRVNPERASQAEVVLAVDKGIIRGVLIAREWLPATPENFPGFPEADPGKYGFVGEEAPDVLRCRYLGKRLPEDFRSTPGASNPVRYSFLSTADV